MDRMTAMLSVGVFVLMAAGLTAQARPSFSGEWKMMRAADGQGEPGVDLTIKQDATAMTLEYRAGGLAQTPGTLTYKLDGSASKNTVAGRAGAAPSEQVSKAIWAGSNLVVTTKTGAGEEKRTFSIDGGYLVVEITAPASKGAAPSITKVAYQRYVRGYGG